MKIIKTGSVYYKGTNIMLIKDNIVEDNSILIKEFPEFFGKVENKVELLVEAPVANLKVEKTKKETATNLKA